MKKNHSAIVMVLFFSLLLSLQLTVWTQAATSWNIETVDSTGNVGSYTSLIINPGHGTCISYYDGTNNDLKYAEKSGLSWNIQTVDSIGDVGIYSSLFASPYGPCISYYDSTNGSLKFAWRILNIAWNVETVDSTGDVGLYTSLALDANSGQHISYYDATNGDLKYAKRSLESWDITTVDSTGNVGAYSSIALDSSGQPCISYCDWTNGDLKYAKKVDSTWVIETVDSTANVGAFCSLALNSGGNPRISYQDYTDGNLKYAEKSGSTWSTATIDSTGDVGWYTSLFLDSSGSPHISYYDNTNEDLKYAKKVDSTWVIETVDSTANVGAFCSLALDSGGNPCISYYDGSSDDLKYALGEAASSPTPTPTPPPIPIPTIANFTELFADGGAKMIYPANVDTKPLGCGAAMVSDWLASMAVSTKMSGYTEGLDTEADFVNQVTGEAMGLAQTGFVSFGGPIINPIVKYAESDSTPTADWAPIRFQYDVSVFRFKHSDGTAIQNAYLPVSVINNDQDMFVIEVYRDGDGRYFMLCYGFGWKGTYAAGKYFDKIVYPDIENYEVDWIIVKWQDSDGNGFVNNPGDGDAYTLIASG